MLHTKVCDLLKIDYPIIQAGMGPFTSPELVAAVSNAGGLGILGAPIRPPYDLTSQIKRIRELTAHPFGVNFLVTSYGEEAFQSALEQNVPLISTALGDPGDFVRKAHGKACLFMHQVHTRKQAVQAKERGVDLIVAQGSEAGGFGQRVSALPLVPQVVDAVTPTPVLAAGGIADGRGVAAALILGADGVVMGTRFLASKEAPIGDSWKNLILNSESEDTTKVEFINDLLPQGASGYGTVPRAIKTDFIQKYATMDKESIMKNADALREEIGKAVMQRRFNEYVPFTGETTGLIRDILPVGEIVKKIVAEAVSCLEQAPILARK